MSSSLLFREQLHLKACVYEWSSRAIYMTVNGINYVCAGVHSFEVFQLSGSCPECQLVAAVRCSRSAITLYA